MRKIGIKRMVLIIEDNAVNREMLSSLLEDEYDVVTAENGEEGYKILSENYNDISLVMLDVYMPVCNGFEFLEKVKDDDILSRVPIIVTTGSNKTEDEEKCLDLGASDFVLKPYNSKIVLGRMRSIIKLNESVATLSAVEYDVLTGAFNMSAFAHYAKKYMSEFDGEFDILAADLQEFNQMNASFGQKKWDETLKYLVEQFAAIFPEAIIGRTEDKFFCLMPSNNGNVKELLTQLKNKAQQEAPIPNLTIKFGYYPNIEKDQPIRVLCDRAVLAAESIRNDFTKFVAVYDKKINEKRLTNQEMELAFDSAIKNNEFVIWYQPKVDCKTEQIIAAEALVRWKKNDGSFISPGVFIPVFESDGLIATLDNYVFRKVCEYQKKRIDEGKKLFPISVNLSRNSIYHEDVVERYKAITDEIGVPVDLVPIELTESATTAGFRTMEFAKELVERGFKLHMDDFGAGYSSLSSLSALPFDIVKIDKGLIDQIKNNKGDIVVRHTIAIAHELGLKVVAEGAEGEEQIKELKNMECDMIQGFFYFAPMDEKRFDDLMENI